MIPASLQHGLRALRHRNYRLFFFGQGTSLIGSWMQRVALSWLAYRLTGSETTLGLIVFLGQAPTAFIATFAGALADRFSKKRMLLWAQVGEMLMAFALAAVVMLGHAQVWQLLLISLISGIVSAFETPIRQSFIVEMLDDRVDLPGAIALNSTLFNSARLIGPALAGILVEMVGEGWCFMLNALSYIAVLWALVIIVPRPGNKPTEQHRFWRAWWEGIQYCWASAGVRTILIMVTIVAVSALPYLALMPAFAKVVLGGDARTFGFLTSAIGIGALAGGVTLAMRRRHVGLPRLILVMMTCFGLGLCAFSLNANFKLSCFLLVLTGYSMMLMFASMNTFLQTNVPDELRGRVLGLYVVCFVGIGPFGSLAAGWIATQIGTPTTLLLGGLVTLLLAVAMGRRLLSIEPRS
ncbi:MFS transporter [bacterium]|nr:MFS transporter [bacterium]